MDNKMTEYILKHSRKKDKELKYDFMPSLLEIIERHIKYAVTFKGEQYGIRELRKHLAWYTKGIHGAAAARDRIFKASTTEEALSLIKQYFNAPEYNL